MEYHSMFRFLTVNIDKDKDTLLESHCRINYDSETPNMRKVPFEEYQKKWLSTSQPKSYLLDLAETMRDKRTIAEILEENSVIVGYVWVRFEDIQDYGITIAAIMDIAVAPDYQRKGIGTMMLRRIEKLAKKRGATLLRSDTGIENVASQKLHDSYGLKPYRIHYEKALQ